MKFFKHNYCFKRIFEVALTNNSSPSTLRRNWLKINPSTYAQDKFLLQKNPEVSSRLFYQNKCNNVKNTSH